MTGNHGAREATSALAFVQRWKGDKLSGMKRLTEPIWHLAADESRLRTFVCCRYSRIKGELTSRSFSVEIQSFRNVGPLWPTTWLR